MDLVQTELPESFSRMDIKIYPHPKSIRLCRHFPTEERHYQQVADKTFEDMSHCIDQVFARQWKRIAMYSQKKRGICSGAGWNFRNEIRTHVVT